MSRTYWTRCLGDSASASKARAKRSWQVLWLHVFHVNHQVVMATLMCNYKSDSRETLAVGLLASIGQHFT